MFPRKENARKLLAGSWNTPGGIRTPEAVIYFGQKLKPDDKGIVKLSLKDIQNESMRALDFLVKVDDVNSLIEKKLVSEKIMEETGIYVSFNLSELEKLAPKWDIIYKLKRVTR